jgi:hypothetical protein
MCRWPLPAQLFSGPSPLDLQTYFSVSDLRLLFSSPPTTRRVTVEVFDPATTRVWEFSESESYVTTDGQSASLSWNKARIWALRPDFYYRRTVAGLLTWGALSDERMGLSFKIAAGSSQRSHYLVRVPWDSRPYFTVSHLRLPFPSPPPTCRVTVEIFTTPPPHG